MSLISPLTTYAYQDHIKKDICWAEYQSEDVQIGDKLQEKPK